MIFYHLSKKIYNVGELIEDDFSSTEQQHKDIEIEIENIRILKYSELPSRLSASYAVDSKSQAKLLYDRYSDWKDSRLYEVKIKNKQNKIHSFNMNIIDVIRYQKKFNNLSKENLEYLIDSYFQKKSVKDIQDWLKNHLGTVPWEFYTMSADHSCGEVNLIREYLIIDELEVTNKLGYNISSLPSVI